MDHTPNQPLHSRLPDRQRVPGLPIPLIERLKMVPRWAWFLAIGFALPLVLIPAVALARYTTTSSAYCLSCHAKGDTPDRGVKSVVHPSFDQVGCVDCHAKPGQVVFEGYVKGFNAEPEWVSDNCKRCHAGTPQTNGQENFKFNFMNIRIPHKVHLELGATCASCHNGITHDLRTPQTNRPKMENCAKCHDTKVSCTKCHAVTLPSVPAPVPAPQPIEESPDGKILYQRTCAGCHGQKGNNVKKADFSSKQFMKQGESTLRKAVAEGHNAMPPFSKARGGILTEQQITAILTYLRTLSEPAPVVGDLAQLYNSNCTSCHGADGNQIAAVPLGSRQFLDKLGDPAIAVAIREGKTGMPAFGTSHGGPLSDSEIAALAAYLQTLAPKPSGAPAASAQGKQSYEKNCTSCHGSKGDGLPSANLASADFLKQKGEAELVRVTAEGKGGMPALGKAKGGPLEKDEITAIVQYLMAAAGGR